MLWIKFENYIKQGRTNLTTIKNQMQGGNKEWRRDPPQPTIINTSISILISSHLSYIQLELCFFIKQFKIQWLKELPMSMQSQERRLPQVIGTILHLAFRVFCSLEHGEPQFWCKFLDFCDSNAENCYVGIAEAACNQMEKQTQQLYYSLHHVLQHTAPSIRKLENPFDFMIHRSTRLLRLTSKPLASSEANNNYHPYKNGNAGSSMKNISM